MTQEIKKEGQGVSNHVSSIPVNLPLELIPLYDWWKAKGSRFVVTAIVVGVIAGSGFGARFYWKNLNANANKDFMQAQNAEDFEVLIRKYSMTPVAQAARLRLAKTYFDTAKYEDALTTYDAVLKKGAPKGFDEIAQLGRAYTLEALNNTEAAMKAYTDFIAQHGTHFLAPQAKIGVARVLALQGKKDDAKKALENLKAEKTGDAAWEMAIAQVESLVTRYQPRAARSLFDLATDTKAPLSPAAGNAPTNTAPTK